MNVKEKVTANLDELLSNLKTLVSYNSVEKKGEDGTPFGKENAACLNTALKICEGYGFKTKNLDNYCGYAEIGEGDQVIGVIGHLDIVPAGEGWDSDPFDMKRDGNIIYGRGVSDDKGPVCASMIALKIIKEMNIPLNKRIRLIMGCNEETGSQCLKYYVEKEGHINMGFTPDGSFPGVHGEKGPLGANFRSKNTSIIDIEGGEARNVVCKHCITKVAANSFSQKKLEDFFNNNDLKYTLNEDNGVVTIDVHGVAAHASMPELGKNAISYTLVGLKQAGFQDPFVEYYVEKIGLDTNGKGLGIYVSDEYGETTLNVGLISMKDGVIEGSIDVRYPITYSSKQMQELIEPNMNNENGEIIDLHISNPLYFPIDSPLITKLLKAYQEVTNDYDSKPITMGGGTYAKGINNCIAFGADFPGSEDNHIHDANECNKVDDLEKQTEIYVAAILELLKD